MRLTAKSEYGVLAAIDLACHYGSGPVSAREIAERRGIPPRFLEQIFVSLRRADLVTAVRGAKGGFALSRAPGDISVLDVVEALEGPLASSLCDQSRDESCGKSHTCAAAPVWARATSALREVFATTTLASLGGAQDSFDRREGAVGT
jgi:Rrf2 family transcriptional regulator, cysteine metabolism repressor